MRKNRRNVFWVRIIVAVLLMLFISGCVQETFSRVEDPVQTVEEPYDTDDDGRKQTLSEDEERRLAEERRREERRQREDSLKEKLGEFFVPLPPEHQADNPLVKAKGIYVTGNSAGLESRFTELLALVESTELNAMVIDVKNDHGLVTYRSEIEIVNNIGANRSVPIKDIDALMSRLREKDIYPIARVVVFRDPYLPEQRPQWAIQKKGGGGPWRDNKRYAWVNPYEKNVWDYNIAIAKEAALKGFREIQFDYVRFPENAQRVDREAEFPGSDGLAKDEAIQSFLAYAREEMAEYNVHISADVFGVIATSWGDSDGIGQTWEKVSPLVEIICPMIYPSHYGPGYFGFAVPDANPSGTVRRALEDAIKRNAPLENPAVIRPWLQSFTATWVRGHIPYGAREVRQQIDAALALGIDEYLIWNASNRYQRNSFHSDVEALNREEAKALERENSGLDVLGRTTEQAVSDYFEALRRKRWRDAYTWQISSLGHEAYRQWFEASPASLREYRVVAQTQNNNHTAFLVTLTLAGNNGQSTELADQEIQVSLQNGVWRVKPSESLLNALTSEQTETETPG